MSPISENGFCVKGTLDILAKGRITVEQAEEIVNIWTEITAKKFYAEGVLDGLRRNKVTHKYTAEQWGVIKDLGM